MGAAVLLAALAPTSAEAFTTEPVGAAVAVATGDGGDDVSVSRALGGGVIVEVAGQALDGAAAGACAWDPDLEQLACPADTILELRLGGSGDTLDVAGDVPVTAYGDGGNDTLVGAVEAHGGDGDDLIELSAGPGTRRAYGDAGDDEVDLSGAAGANGDVQVLGGDGRDTLDASQASGTGIALRGERGADDLRGAVGPTILDGGDGDDSLEDGGGVGATLTGAGGADRITIDGSGATVDASDGDDQIDGTGATGPVRIDAGAGADAVQVVGSGSTVLGGDGPDVLDAGGATGAITVDGGLGDDRIEIGGAGSTVRADAGNDTIDGSGASGILHVEGGLGADQIVLGGVDSDAVGGDGDDAIDATGVRGAARIDGGAGQDRIALGGSGSTATGGDGDDDLDASDVVGPASLDGGPGNDTLRGGGVGDVLRGGPGDDRLDGGAGANRLEAGDGDDVLLSGEEPSVGEQLSGGAGYDRVSYENTGGGVRVVVGNGPDDGRLGELDDVGGDVEQIDGSDDDDTLVAGPTDTVLVGHEGDDALVGQSGRDTLIGGPGDDRLDGGPGVVPDVFSGDEGRDELSYATRTAPLTVDMRSRDPRGGEVGEGDLYRDPIENVIGGGGDDTITGQPGVGHRIAAGAGDDRVRVVEPPGSGSDAVADGVRCQAGRDIVESDRFDTVAGDCERVLVDAKLRRALAVFSPSLRASLSRHGQRLSVRLGCDRDVRSFCSTKVVVRRPGSTKTLARVERVRILPGRWRKIVLTAPSAAAARSLWRQRRVLVVVLPRDRVGQGTLVKSLLRVVRSGRGPVAATPSTAPRRTSAEAGRSTR